MTTIKQFKEYCSEEVAALVIPVKNQMGYDKEDFFNELKNVANSPCGAAGGFAGFVWYTETTKFWRKNRKKIMALANELADSLGENAFTMICSFNGFKGNFTEDEIGRAIYGNYNPDLEQIYNGMAWFALEEVAHYYSEYEYENQ